MTGKPFTNGYKLYDIVHLKIGGFMEDKFVNS